MLRLAPNLAPRFARLFQTEGLSAAGGRAMLIDPTFDTRQLDHPQAQSEAREALNFALKPRTLI